MKQANFKELEDCKITKVYYNGEEFLLRRIDGKIYKIRCEDNMLRFYLIELHEMKVRDIVEMDLVGELRESLR